jgi:hypothetical protein
MTDRPCQCADCQRRLDELERRADDTQSSLRLIFVLLIVIGVASLIASMLEG